MGNPVFREACKFIKYVYRRLDLIRFEGRALGHARVETAFLMEGASLIRGKAICDIITRGGHFHINLYGTCRFSGYHFSA